jgi:hypothetical protein
MSDPALQMQIQTLQKQIKELQELTKYIKVSGNQLTIKSTTGITIDATNIDLKAAGVINIKGSIVKLNGGGKPVATIGSMTSGGQGPHTIVNGSPTVFVP